MQLFEKFESVLTTLALSSTLGFGLDSNVVVIRHQNLIVFAEPSRVRCKYNPLCVEDNDELPAEVSIDHGVDIRLKLILTPVL